MGLNLNPRYLVLLMRYKSQEISRGGEGHELLSTRTEDYEGRRRFAGAQCGSTAWAQSHFLPTNSNKLISGCWQTMEENDRSYGKWITGSTVMWYFSWRRNLNWLTFYVRDLIRFSRLILDECRLSSEIAVLFSRKARAFCHKGGFSFEVVYSDYQRVVCGS